MVNQRGLASSVSRSSGGRGHRVADLDYSVSGLSRGQTDSMVHSLAEQRWMFTVNHIASINCVVQLNTPGY